ncbi:MAG: tetratricopeptide repeat protein [Xanthobacteraceae bacterium]
MRSAGRVVVAAFAGLLWLNGCETSTKLGDIFGGRSGNPQTTSSLAASGDPAITGSVGAPRVEPNGGSSGLLGKDPYDDVSLGKKYYRSGHFGLAEKHFRAAVERAPRDAEAWVGLAASYDRLKRFDLADRAYAQAIGILGQTPEILNNRGYSYILRGDYVRARKTLLAAQAMDPANPFIKNNLLLLAKSAGQGRAVR